LPSKGSALSASERARRKRPDSLDTYDLYLRALPYAFTAMPEVSRCYFSRLLP